MTLLGGEGWKQEFEHHLLSRRGEKFSGSTMWFLEQSVHNRGEDVSLLLSKILGKFYQISLLTRTFCVSWVFAENVMENFAIFMYWPLACSYLRSISLAFCNYPDPFCKRTYYHPRKVDDSLDYFVTLVLPVKICPLAPFYIALIGLSCINEEIWRKGITLPKASRRLHSSLRWTVH